MTCVNNLEAVVKTRVTREVRERLEAQAAARELGVSDIVREALREYLRTQPAPANIAQASGPMEGAA